MLLSVVMPSNRNLANSKRAIETALAFCEKRNAQLIVSDNSRDKEKERALHRISPRLLYSQPERDGLNENWLHAMSLAKTEFMTMMGDDDELFVSPKDTPLDLATVTPDCIGVRPLVAVANKEGRVVAIKTFGIMNDLPGERVMTYNENANGDNSAFYSIYRRKPFVDLHRLFLLHHPLKAGWCDWALATALFSFGKLPYDPGTVYKYNRHNWDSNEQIQQQLQKMYTDTGLPETTGRYSLLLLYLDLLTMAMHKDSPLDAAGRHDLMLRAGQRTIGQFARTVINYPESYDAALQPLAQALLKQFDLDEQFELALRMVDHLQPGLEVRYRAFRQQALNG